jgi:protocatechuate 3,4-dioxygenase beta subunit
MIRGASRGLETPDAVVVNGGEPEVIVRLAKRVRVTLSGVVTDAGGHPMANARVQVIRQEGKFGMGMGRPELTDRQGRYRVSGLMPSMRYTVQAESPGLGSAAAKVELDASKETAEAPPLKFQAVSQAIAGTVVDAAGKPVAGVAVEIDGEETGRQATVTDAQGRFEFRAVSGARAKIKVGGDAPAWDVRAGDGEIRLTIKSRGGDDAGRRGG